MAEVGFAFACVVVLVEAADLAPSVFDGAAVECSVRPMPELGAWKPELDRLLAINEARPVRERLTRIRILKELHRTGYEGGYDVVRHYARGGQREQSSLRRWPSYR